MVSATDIPASQLVNRDFETVRTEDSLSVVRNVMEGSDLRAVPVLDDSGSFAGAISYRDLVRSVQFDASSAKARKVMHQPPEIDPGDSLIELADLRINSGRKMLVHTQGNSLRGVVSDREFLEAFRETEELENISFDHLSPPELFKVFEDDSIEKARHLMLDENISRLPVVDGDGRLTGMVTSLEMLKALVERESQGSEGASGNRSGEEYSSNAGNEKVPMKDIPVKEIMNRSVATTDGNLSGSEAASRMSDEGSNYLLKTSDRYPDSIVTVKDFVDHFSGFKQSETVLVSLVGLDVPEEKSAVHEKIRNQIDGSLGRKLDSPEEIKFRFRKADEDGSRHRYEVKVQLVEDGYVLNVQEEDWDLLDVVDSALEELDRRVGRQTGRD
ncbi:MAG: CBS domain-containing protein [Candidatus Nanohaloarchaea archaeon]